jgi:hypothetical protein
LQSDPQPDFSAEAVSPLPLQHDEDFDISQLAIFDLSQLAILHFVVSLFESEPIVLEQQPAFVSFVAVALVVEEQHLPVAVTSVVVFALDFFPS